MEACSQQARSQLHKISLDEIERHLALFTGRPSPEREQMLIARRDLLFLTSLSAAPLQPAPALRPFSGSVSLGEMALYPDPALRTVAQPVTEYGAPAAALGDALVGAMDRLGAVGLAANQMHVDARVIALGGAATPTIFVNPRIVQRSDELRMVPWREVCLTLPEIDGVDLLRDEWVDVDFTRAPMARRSRRASPASARAPSSTSSTISMVF